MCTNARISLTAGFAAAFIFTLCPLAAQAKNSSSGHASTGHSSGSKGSNGKSNMHTVPLTKVSHDSGKYKTNSKHNDSQYCHEDHKCHDKSCDHCHDHDYCKDHCHDHDYCKDHCHNHDYCKDHCHDCCHDHCCHDCWPCGFCWDFPCFDGCCCGGCDGGCCDCDDGCDCGEQVIIVNNNGCDDNGSVVVDGE
ncbi:MAG TPA: hypothetical protein VG056_00710 [Pirellulales bacterium]|nr:hypothetical protein [Pirellulales bacterium]